MIEQEINSSGKINLDFIHIGLHRTASTFMQTQIFSNLKNANILEFNNSHSVLRGLFDDLILCPPPFLDEEKVFREIASEFKSNNYSGISSEGLSGMNSSFFGGSQINYTAQRLGRIFNPKKILIVIRSHFSYVYSNYVADVRFGATTKFQEWIDRSSNNRELHFAQFSNIIKLYMDIFGRDKVLVLPYEELFKNGLLIDFVNEFNYEIDEKHLLSNKGKNQSYYSTINLNLITNRLLKTKINSGATVGVYDDIRLYNFLRQKFYPKLERMNTLFSNSDSRRDREARYFKEHYSDQFVGDVKRTSELIGYDLYNLGYPYL